MGRRSVNFIFSPRLLGWVSLKRCGGSLRSFKPGESLFQAKNVVLKGPNTIHTSFSRSTNDGANCFLTV